MSSNFFVDSIKADIEGSSERVYNMLESAYYNKVAHKYQIKIIEEFLKPFNLKDEELLEATKDIVIMAGRRSGKSYIVSCCIYYTLTVLKLNVCIVIPELVTFEQSLWLEIQQRAKETHNFRAGEDIVYNINRKTVKFPKKPYGHIRLYPVAKKGKADSLRALGKGVGLFVIEEAGVYPTELLKSLVVDAIDPIKSENFRIRTIILGTPNPSATGMFVNLFQTTETISYNFSIYDNPFIPNPQSAIDTYLRKNGLTLESPTCQREMFGKIVKDLDSLVFRYTDNEQTVSRREILKDMTTEELTQAGWSWGGGVDIGYTEATTIVIFAYNRYTGQIIVEYADYQTKPTVPDINKMVDKAHKLYPQAVLYCDTRSGGALNIIQSLVVAGYRGFLVPAEKEKKMSDLKLLNSSMRLGKFYIPKSGCKHIKMLTEELATVRWLPDVDKTQWKHVDKRFVNDLTDALLYGVRRISSLASVKNIYNPIIETKYERLEREMEERNSRTKSNSDKGSGYW